MTDIQENVKIRPHRITEIKIGNTLFTVISVQSEFAKETAFDKVQKLILSNCTMPTEKLSVSSNLN